MKLQKLSKINVRGKFAQNYLVNKKLHFYELYRANVDLIYLQMKYSRVVIKNSVVFNQPLLKKSLFQGV